MPDIVSITTTLAAIKNSIDIAKSLKNVDASLEKAGLRLKTAELIETLAEAKINATEVQDLIRDKDKKIAELEALLAFKEKLTFKKGMYYKTDENLTSEDEPYCSRCWDYEQKAVHLFKQGKDFFECPQCKYIFGISQGIY